MRPPWSMANLSSRYLHNRATGSICSVLNSRNRGVIICSEYHPSYRFSYLGASCRGLLMLLMVICLHPASGQTNFHTITANGPISNRLNLVFLSEGYTSAQFAQFLTHATNTAAVLFTGQPFADYLSYFNVSAIAVASVESGSDHPASGIFRNTFFN